MVVFATIFTLHTKSRYLWQRSFNPKFKYYKLVCGICVQLVFKVSHMSMFLVVFFSLYLAGLGGVTPNVCIIYVFNHNNFPIFNGKNTRFLSNGVFF